MYVLAGSERDALWARQAVARGDFGMPVRVVSSQGEAARIDRWLSHAEPDLAYHRVRMDKPHEPTLLLSKERSSLNEAARDQLAKRLLDALPYANTVNIGTVSDDRIARDAHAALERMAIPSTRHDANDSATFLIQEALSDGDLQRLRMFAEDFREQWGGRYVQFAIDLKDDWLKGKSFSYGASGYVRAAPGHWFFSQTQ
ncbi:hypothetical protein WJ64_32645 [Burkholderia ubonensis]|nr:hypothetical protein WJ64_32645 [Burkholderia ubonensis]